MGPIFGGVRIFLKRDPFFDPPWGGYSTKPVNKEYWKARVIRHNSKRAYYTVQYKGIDKEELTHEEIKVYHLIPPDKGEYWTEQ